MTRFETTNRYTRRADLFALRRFLSREAERLREKAGCMTPPYDPESVAEVLGVRVEETYMNGVDGYVEVRSGEYVAVISTKTHFTRQRFTLAHELCHVLFMKLEANGTRMPLKRYRTKRKSVGAHQDPIEESLCNYFASELLLPSSDVKKRLDKCSVEPGTIFGLASDFNVSKQAAAVKVFKCKEDVTACALWSLESLWPMPVWWTGKKTGQVSEMEALESLVGTRTDLTEVWESYGEGNQRVKIRISPAMGMRFALILITKMDFGLRRF